jgi:hypothetical protein
LFTGISLENRENFFLSVLGVVTLPTSDYLSDKPSFRDYLIAFLAASGINDPLRLFTIASFYFYFNESFIELSEL